MHGLKKSKQILLQKIIMKLKIITAIFLVLGIAAQTGAMDKKSAFLNCRSVKKAERLLKDGIEIPNTVLFDPDLSLELFEFYLRNGARAKANEQGDTPLHLICNMWTGHEEIQKAGLLVKIGINLCARDKSDENTALHCAARFGASMTADMARISGADFLRSHCNSLCSTIVESCREQYQTYQERFTFLCCLKRLGSPLSSQKDLLRARFGLPRNTSPYQLLTTENKAGQIPHDIWQIDVLDPKKVLK
jgi:hypothetical protein